MTKPIFISGMPRSGTKLLRDILNNHSKVSIPDSETHFIPEFIRTFGLEYDFSNDNNVQAVLHRFHTTKFCLVQQKPRIEKMNFRNTNSPLTWAIFFESILRYYGVKDEVNTRFGDKTPGYILHLTLLKEIWPDIKMVHIIRDPRDYSASVRHAWGMSLRRAAHRWSSTMEATIKYRQQYPDNYLEIHYEDLLNDPDNAIEKICLFIGCDFEKDLSILNYATENLGAARGHIGLVTTNKNKYKENLTQKEIQAVERICCATGKAMGYLNDPALKELKLGSGQLLLLKLYDGANALRFHCKEKGIIKGLRYFLKLHREGAFKGKAK